MGATSSETVILSGGLVVDLAALQLLWHLEERALIVRVDPDGWLWVGPRDQLTDDDRTAIREHRDQLIVLVEYCQSIH